MLHCLVVLGLFGQLLGIAFGSEQFNHTVRHMSTCLNVETEKVLKMLKYKELCYYSYYAH